MPKRPARTAPPRPTAPGARAVRTRSAAPRAGSAASKPRVAMPTAPASPTAWGAPAARTAAGGNAATAPTARSVRRGFVNRSRRGAPAWQIALTEPVARIRSVGLSVANAARRRPVAMAPAPACPSATGEAVARTVAVGHAEHATWDRPATWAGDVSIHRRGARRLPIAPGLCAVPIPSAGRSAAVATRACSVGRDSAAAPPTVARGNAETMAAAANAAPAPWGRRVPRDNVSPLRPSARVWPIARASPAVRIPCAARSAVGAARGKPARAVNASAPPIAEVVCAVTMAAEAVAESVRAGRTVRGALVCVCPNAAVASVVPTGAAASVEPAPAVGSAIRSGSATARAAHAARIAATRPMIGVSATVVVCPIGGRNSRPIGALGSSWIRRAACM